MNIRPAELRDADAINAIYNHEVTGSTATFDTVPSSRDQRTAWLRAHAAEPRHPVLVGDEAGSILGWASLSSWSERCAYARAAEVSIYVHADARRRGVGRALLEALVSRAHAAGLGVLLARISSGEGPGSVALHRAVGFQRVGTMRRVGDKHGRILDIELLELHLDEGDVV